MRLQKVLDSIIPNWCRAGGFIISSLLLAGPTTAVSADLDGLSISDRRQLEASVDAYLQPYVSSHNFSGTILVAHGDNILINHGYGMADHVNSTANSAETKFMIASLSKTFTAAAILLLQERNQLNVDDPVDRIVPGFPRGNEITIHQLLTHTSGLPRIVFFPDYGEKSKLSHSVEDLVSWFSDKPLAFSPGERYGYSNANYILLAHIIERLSGRSYGEFLSLNILDPVGLRATGHLKDPKLAVDDLAKGYVPQGATDIVPAKFHDYSIDTGSGSLYSTTEDLLRWFTAQRRGEPLGQSPGMRIVGGVGLSMEYGWNLERRFDREVITKTGWDGVGFGAQFVHYLDNDLTIIVLTNFNVSSITTEIADNIAAIINGDAYQPLHLSLKPNVESSVLQDMTGLYQFGSDFYVPDATIRIVEQDGQLLIPGDSRSPIGALLPISPLEFIHRQHWFRVTFKQDANKNIEGMQYGEFNAQKVIAR